jgi:Senescence-associated protein
MAVDIGKVAAKEFASSERGKNIKENYYYKHAANVGGGFVHLVGGVWSGLENAFVSVAKGTKGMTESVLEHKYGGDVKEAF